MKQKKYSLFISLNKINVDEKGGNTSFIWSKKIMEPFSVSVIVWLWFMMFFLLETCGHFQFPAKKNNLLIMDKVFT